VTEAPSVLHEQQQHEGGLSVVPRSLGPN
jgi:hypothetical protein